MHGRSSYQMVNSLLDGKVDGNEIRGERDGAWAIALSMKISSGNVLARAVGAMMLVDRGHGVEESLG